LTYTIEILRINVTLLNHPLDLLTEFVIAPEVVVAG